MFSFKNPMTFRRPKSWIFTLFLSTLPSKSHGWLVNFRLNTKPLNLLICFTGGAFEWDDDFPSPEPNFLSKAASDHSASRPSGTSAASKYFSPPPANRTLEQSWNSPSNYSRFSISPASIASFSLTHLTDSDIEQGGKFSTNIHTQTEWDLKNLNSQSFFSFSFSGSGEDGEKD